MAAERPETFIPALRRHGVRGADEDIRTSSIVAKNVQDSRLHVSSLDELLGTFNRFVAAFREERAVRVNEVLDCFGALVHTCMATDYEYHCRADKFFAAEVQAQYELTRAPILCVWNVLFREFDAVHPAMRELVAILFAAVSPCLRYRASLRTSVHCHYMILFSLLGYLLPTSVCYDVIPPPSLLVPAWSYGLELVPEEAVTYAAGLFRQWVPKTCLSVVWAATEMSCDLPSIVFSRCMVCFNNLRVITVVPS